MKALIPQKKLKDRIEAVAHHTVYSKPWLRNDHPAAQPWIVRLQTVSKADFTFSFQVSANKVLKTSVPLPREGKGRGHINAGSLLTTLNQSRALCLSQGGKGSVCYHSFFFSSMETPPGPRATTRSRPPITDMVWKKSYFRKSCMGL